MIIFNAREARMCRDPKVLAKYAMTTNLEIRIAVAKNVKTPTSALNDLSYDQEGEVLLAVAANTNTGKRGLYRLGVNLEDKKIALAVANNSKTTMDILDEMFEVWKDCPEIVKAIKTHPNVSDNTAVLCTFREME